MNNVLLIGSGGRESAIVMSIIQDQIKMLYAFKNFANKSPNLLSPDVVKNCVTRLNAFCKNRKNLEQDEAEFFAAIFNNNTNIINNKTQNVINSYLNTSFIVDNLYCIPGNPQISKMCQTFNISTSNESITAFCKQNNISFVIIGPEDPLANGLTDELEALGISVFGPSKLAAQIESSKIFMKDFCTEFKIPTAKYQTFYSDQHSKEQIIAFAKSLLNGGSQKIVLKTNGLAAGKGVVICDNIDSFTFELNSYFDGKFGVASKSIVVEEFMHGKEVSFFAVCDGTSFKTIGYACDHKKLLDGNKGPNTGGMGTYSYKEILTQGQIVDVESNIIKPLVDGMIKRGHPYHGVIFAGLMLTNKGIRLIEYNARFGDPETQAILPLLQNNIMEIFTSATKSVSGLKISLQDASCINVVCVSGGYPDEYKKDIEININFANILELPFTSDKDTSTQPNKTSILSILKYEIANLFNSLSGKKSAAQIIHCGTKINNKNELVTNGGRVISVRAKAKNISTARSVAYKSLSSINFDGMFYRKDI